MSKLAMHILLLILLFPFVGCNSSTGTPSEASQTPTSTQIPVETPSTKTLPPPPSLSSTPDAVLLHIQGDVRVQQAITGQTVMAMFGAYLWRGDVIVTGQEAQAEIACSDGVSIIQVKPNQSLTINCGQTSTPVSQPISVGIDENGQTEALSIARQSLDNCNQPLILSPRDNSHLIKGRPTIRWLAVEGAEAYTVVVSDLKSDLWQMTTQEPELPYPETKPQLEAGESYLIKVTAQMGLAEQPRSSESVLVIMLPPTEVEQLRRFENQIEGLELSVESAGVVLAAHYADHKLYDLAIAELVPLTEIVPSPLVYRLLGDMYLAVGLGNEANQSYQEAHNLAQAQNNPLALAQAEVGLGHMAYAARDSKRALGHYQEALTLYRNLDQEDNAKTVAEFVANAKTELSAPTPEDGNCE